MSMSAGEYRTALTALGLSQLAAGRWLGVSPKTAQRYAVDGPSGPAARAVGMAVAVKGLAAWHTPGGRIVVNHDQITDAIGLPAK